MAASLAATTEARTSNNDGSMNARRSRSGSYEQSMEECRLKKILGIFSSVAPLQQIVGLD